MTRPRTSAPPEPLPGLAELYDAHVADVERWVLRLYGPSPDAEDLVHDVFIVAGKRIETFRGDGKLSTWLFGIVRKLVDKRRRRDRWRRFLRGAPEEFADGIPAPGPLPIDELERREDEAALYRALEGLDEAYRTPLILFELEGLPADEIGQLLGLTVGTVWVRLHRARRKLLGHLGPRREGRA